MKEAKWRNFFFQKETETVYFSLNENAGNPEEAWYMRMKCHGRDWIQARSNSLHHVQLECINNYVERYHATEE